jgi:hypothetical protein
LQSYLIFYTFVALFDLHMQANAKETQNRSNGSSAGKHLIAYYKHDYGLSYEAY